MDVLTPGSSQMLAGFLVWVAVTVGATVGVALDLRRRGVAAWWMASALTLLVLPVGLVAYASLRGPARTASATVSRTAPTRSAQRR